MASAIWEWSNDTLVWNEYLPNASQTLETAYASNTLSFTLSVTPGGPANYTVDFFRHDGWEIDVYGVARPLKRSTDPTFSAFSATWERWADDTSTWKRYESQAASAIESVWQECERSKHLNRARGPAGLKLTIQNQLCKILFATEGIQVNLTTSGMRGVRRRSGPSINPIPQVPPSVFIPTVSLFNSTVPSYTAGPTASIPFLGAPFSSQVFPQLLGSSLPATPLTSFGQSSDPKGYDPADLVAVPNPDKDLTCSICTDELSDSMDAPSASSSSNAGSSSTSDPKAVKLSKCNHHFHVDCIKEWFKQKPVCPVCLTKYGNFIGTQPTTGATMRVIYHPFDSVVGWEIDGFPNTDVIEILYILEDGIQGPEHPNPGQPYKGTIRRAYLPKNQQGEEILELLQEAWRRRLIFRVGTSLTTGLTNRVVWGCIHHKTSLDGGPSNFGYPDDSYFARVKGELTDLGVYS